MRQAMAHRMRWALATMAVLAGLLPAMAGAQGITLTRTPAPPQAILQAGTQSIGYTVTYGTVAESFRLSVFDPAGRPLLSEPTGIQNRPSPLTGTRAFVPGSAAPLGRYRAQLDFFSFPGQLETSAFVTFDVADALGTIGLVKFEDLNGNGTREPGEPGVPGWRFSLVNPQGNGTVVTTGPDGTISIPGVPAGDWVVSEVMEPGWIPITPASGPVTIPAGGVGVFGAANARPADICGTVFVDADRDGVRDPAERGHAGARLALSGHATPPAAVTSDADGAYCFTALPPGTYAVALDTPRGFTATTPATIPGIALRSGANSGGNDFGIAAPGGGTAQGGPAPDVRIGKAGPRTARRGQAFTYRIVVRNRSRVPARAVEVTDLVPIDLLLTRIPAGATIRNGVVTWRVGTLPAGARRALAMRVRVGAQARGVIRNTATVTVQGLPPRRATARTRVQGPPPVQRTGGVTG